MQEKPCKTGDSDGMPVYLSECLLIVRGLDGPATCMPSCSMMVVRYFPCLLIFLQF